MKPDEVLLEYVLDDPTSFCLVVSQKGAYVRVLPAGRKEIENLSQQFVGEIRTKGTGAELSKRLYAMLVTPVPAVLHNFSQIGTATTLNNLASFVRFRILEAAQGITESDEGTFEDQENTLIELLQKSRTQVLIGQVANSAVSLMLFSK